MKTKKIAAICIAGILGSSILMGCQVKTEKAGDENAPVKETTKNEKEDGDSLKIGVALLYKGDEWLAAISDEYEKQAEELGYEINVQDGNQDNEKQMQQIENFIAQDYDAIIISAADSEGIIPAVEKAEAAGIPVVATDTPIDYPHVSTTVAWDNYATGVKLGEYAKKYIEDNYGDKEKVNLVMINAPSYPHLVKRDEGFLSIIDTIDKVEIIATQDANGSRETSANIINNNVAKGIDMVYGVIDNHAWGAVTALEEANVEECAVLSCGGFGDEPFDALENDHKYYKAIIVVPPVDVVRDTLSATIKAIKGEKLEMITNTNFGLADADNVGDFR